MPRRLVNREELGRLIARTSGAISMINESSYSVDQNPAITLILSLQLNLDGFVHVQITLATIPSASMCMQLKFIAIKT